VSLFEIFFVCGYVSCMCKRDVCVCCFVCVCVSGCVCVCVSGGSSRCVYSLWYLWPGVNDMVCVNVFMCGQCVCVCVCVRPRQLLHCCVCVECC